MASNVDRRRSATSTGEPCGVPWRSSVASPEASVTTSRRSQSEPSRTNGPPMAREPTRIAPRTAGSAEAAARAAADGARAGSGAEGVVELGVGRLAQDPVRLVRAAEEDRRRSLEAVVQPADVGIRFGVFVDLAVLEG